MWKTNCPSLLHLFFFSFALFVFWFTIMLLQKAKSEWEGGKEKEREGEGGRGENDRKLDRRTWWRVCEIRKERQTTLLYILEAVGQYLNNSWSTEMDFFFLQWLLDPKGWGSPNFLISSRSESSLADSCGPHPLVQHSLHLPRCTSCLIHQLHSFPNVAFSSSSEVFMMDGWWISGFGKDGVTRVRGGQIRRLNIRVWMGRRRRRRRRWR